MMGFWDGSGISWTICKQSAPCSRQITTPTPHHSVFYRPDALPDAQPTVSKHCFCLRSKKRFNVFFILVTFLNILNVILFQKRFFIVKGMQKVMLFYTYG